MGGQSTDPTKGWSTDPLHVSQLTPSRPALGPGGSADSREGERKDDGSRGEEGGGSVDLHWEGGRKGNRREEGRGWGGVS